MNDRPMKQSGSTWKWVAIILICLFVLMVTCVTSAVWSGAIGYAIGRRVGYQTMDHHWYEEPYEVPPPKLYPMPEMPEMPHIPEMPFVDPQPWLGVTFVMEPEGAIVVEVSPESPAERAGIEMDDIITEVDGTAVTEASPLNELILRYEPQDRIELTVERDGRERTVRVRLAMRLSDEIPWHPNRFPESVPVVPDWEG